MFHRDQESWLFSRQTSGHIEKDSGGSIPLLVIQRMDPPLKVVSFKTVAYSDNLQLVILELNYIFFEKNPSSLTAFNQTVCLVLNNSYFSRMFERTLYIEHPAFLEK